jgi:hypothetical protein
MRQEPGERAPLARIRPTAGAAALVVLAARRLPANERERYCEEFRAELCAVTALRQIAVGVSYLFSARSLGRVLAENASAWPAYLGPRPLEGNMNGIWTCRIGIHRYATVTDGDYPPVVYKECRHCGKVKHRSDFGGGSGPVYMQGSGDSGATAADY